MKIKEKKSSKKKHLKKIPVDQLKLYLKTW